MEATAGKFEGVNDSLQTMLNRLMNELEILQTAFQGAGGKSFEQVKQAWAADQKKLQDALRETAGAIRTAGKQYTASDEESASKIANINTGGINLPL